MDHLPSVDRFKRFLSSMKIVGPQAYAVCGPACYILSDESSTSNGYKKLSDKCDGKPCLHCVQQENIGD